MSQIHSVVTGEQQESLEQAIECTCKEAAALKEQWQASMLYSPPVRAFVYNVSRA
jgi:hypothetical protein